MKRSRDKRSTTGDAIIDPWPNLASPKCFCSLNVNFTFKHFNVRTGKLSWNTQQKALHKMHYIHTYLMSLFALFYLLKNVPNISSKVANMPCRPLHVFNMASSQDPLGLRMRSPGMKINYLNSP